MRRVLIVLTMVISFQLSAQNESDNEVLEVVNRVFQAMKTNDSTLLKSCFTKDVRMSTIFIDQNGKIQIKEGSFVKFMEAIGKEKSDVFNEPIWNEQIQRDGPLAAVWVDYAFYLNNTFSHCGVDAFHLVKQEGGWKIFNLVDTRRKADCAIPDDIKKQFGG